ncbi:hypothetical protein [Phenylobacterium sp. CCH9-H3]|uniref:hypothetical protein n=1 Tax=Phenylobacterium sp. CCH9-H3 TaxID=1768774 RepID=UPI000839E2A8
MPLSTQKTMTMMTIRGTPTPLSPRSSAAMVTFGADSASATAAFCSSGGRPIWRAMASVPSTTPFSMSPALKAGRMARWMIRLESASVRTGSSP